MVWAGVSFYHKTNIVFINGNLTAARYQHEVLDTEVIPLLKNHRGMQLLHDGAPTHQARATTSYLNANNVNVVDSPPPQITRLTQLKTFGINETAMNEEQGLFRPQ